MRPKPGSAERQIAKIASRQHGVITVGQLLAAGLSRSAVKRRVERGLLHRVHRGVYRLGHDGPSTEARYLAAVLACGEGAVLSGLAAASLRGLIKSTPLPEVTTTSNRRVKGVTVRRVRELPPSEVTRYRGIPITTVPRTVVDIAASLSLDALAQACHEAEVRFRITWRMVEEVLARRPNTAGAGNLHKIFRGDTRLLLSELERAFLRLLRSARLPLPQTNRAAGAHYVDCRWPEHRLTVELDSYRYHHTRHAWEQDHRRERAARARGDEFRRYTYGDVTEEPGVLLAELTPLLSGAPASDSRTGGLPPTRSAGSRKPGSRRFRSE